MALQGTLREYNLGQLLNLIHIAHKSGGLTVQAPQGTAELFFDEGKLVAASSGQSQTLTDLMVRAGKLTPDQAANLAVSSGAVDDKQLGLLLLNTGQITRDDIVHVLRQTMLDAVQTVWSWEEGQFTFDQRRTPPPGRVTIPVSLERFLVEAKRPRVEPTLSVPANTPTPPPTPAPLTQSDTLNFDLALRFVEGFGEQLRSINLSPKEWKAISAINPRNAIREVARRAGMSDSEIQETVQRLLREGLVEIAGEPETDSAAPTALPTPTGAASPAPSASASTQNLSREASSYTPPSTELEPATVTSAAAADAKPGAVKRFLSRFSRS